MLFRSYYPADTATAAAHDVLTISCTDIASSNWNALSGVHHNLIAPNPPTGNELLAGVHSIRIDQSAKKVLLDQTDPNDPGTANHRYGALVPTITDNAIAISNALPANLAGAVRLKITIDRRTGLLVETDELFDSNGQVESTLQYLRICSTDKPKF